MNFVGLLIMQNKLKCETTPAMNTLNEANIKNIMVTGDNPLTACHVAADCHLISSDQNIFLSDSSFIFIFYFLFFIFKIIILIFFFLFIYLIN